MPVRMLLALFLAILLALPAPVFAQQAAPGPAGQAPATVPDTLKILVLQGQNAINSVRDGTITQPVVEVHDDNDLPVEGADVLFELPATGPGGFFPGPQFVKTTRTNPQGQAGVTFALNPVPGRFEIKVTATQRNRTGHAVIMQTTLLESAAKEKSGAFKFRWWKVALIAGAAGAVIGIVVATRGGSKSSGSSGTITLTPGGPTFGSP